MREVHIMSPLWLGDRKEMHVGIAHYRLVDSTGKPHKGNMKIWIDYKVQDKNSPTPDAKVLMYRYPFVISCSKAVSYPTQTLLDFNRTILHIIPIADLKIYKTKRKRTMPQADFKELLSKPELTDKESLLLASLVIKKEQEIKRGSEIE